MGDAVLYSEIDPHASEWLRRLVADGQIAPGRVLEGDIRDIRPDSVQDAAQFHSFAGIGAWSHALHLAGWPDDVPVWTGSCPCQPFSGAGKRKGFSDERHLWPEWRRLIDECRPPVVFGEQVASPDGRAWLAVVRSEMEALGYAVGAADLCAAGLGAPHARQRLFFGAVRVGASGGGPWRRGVGVAGDPECERRDARALPLRDGAQLAVTGQRGALGALADDTGERRQRGDASRRGKPAASGRGRVGALADGDVQRRDGPGLRLQPRGPRQAGPEAARGGEVGRLESGCLELGDSDGARLEGWPGERGDHGAEHPASQRAGGGLRFDAWSDAAWVYCTDEKHRPVEPGTFPLAYGVAGRMAVLRPGGDYAATEGPQAPHWYNRAGALKGLGNAIVPQVAAAFVRSFAESLEALR